MKTHYDQRDCANPECTEVKQNPFGPYCGTCYFFLPDDHRKDINAASNYYRLWEKYPADFDQRLEAATSAINKALAER